MKEIENNNNVGGKTPEEIKKGLECCANGELCYGYCPYGDNIFNKVGCSSELSSDALALIEQLERKNKDLLEERELNDFLRDKVKKLEAQVPKWISVEERLPEGNGPYCQNVIVLTIKKEVMPGFCNHGLWYVMRPEDDYCNDADEGEVTHWMPLPKPPKE